MDDAVGPLDDAPEGWLHGVRDRTGAGAVVTYGGGGLSAGRTGFSGVERALLRGLRGRSTRPKVTLVPTASGDDDAFMDAFRAACDTQDAEGHVLSLFRRTEAPFGNVLDEADLVYVTGGAVANLAALWRLHGLAAEVVAAWRRGPVVAGSSAGALIWSRGGVTTSFGTPAGWTDGLGVVPHSLRPHDDTQPGRRALPRPRRVRRAAARLRPGRGRRRGLRRRAARSRPHRPGGTGRPPRRALGGLQQHALGKRLQDCRHVVTSNRSPTSTLPARVSGAVSSTVS